MTALLISVALASGDSAFQDSLDARSGQKGGMALICHGNILVRLCCQLSIEPEITIAVENISPDARGMGEVVPFFQLFIGDIVVEVLYHIMRTIYSLILLKKGTARPTENTLNLAERGEIATL